MSQVNMRKVAGLADTIQLGKGGQKVRSSGSVLEARNAADSAYAVFRVADGVADNDAVNLGQVNNLLDGLKWMDPVTVVNTIGNITLSGEQTIDGVLTSSDRVLLTQQTVPSQNGVWVTGAGAWTRPSDFDTGDAAAAKTCIVMEGTSYADTRWTCTTNSGSDVIDTNNLAFAQSATAGGVSSVASAATGVSLVKTGTGAVVLNDIADGSQIGASLAADLITLTIKSGQVGTTELAAGAVTQPKIAALAASFRQRVTVAFGTQGTPQNIGAALPANVEVIRWTVEITTDFDDAACTIELGRSGAQTEIEDGSAIDQDQANSLNIGQVKQAYASSTQLTVLINSSTNTQGAAVVEVEYIRTS